MQHSWNIHLFGPLPLYTITSGAIRTAQPCRLVFAFPRFLSVAKHRLHSQRKSDSTKSCAGRATDMPGSVRTVDATSQRYDPEESLPSSPEQQRADPIKHRASLIELPPSPADSGTTMRHASPRGDPSITSSPSATTREEQRITRNIDRGTPGDQAIFSDAKTPEQRELAKRKSQYYGEVFATRESNSSARERVLRESPILADVRTNVIVSYPASPFSIRQLTMSRSLMSTPLSPTCPIIFPLDTSDLKILSSSR